MKRGANVYRCQACGFASPKPGTCPDCARTGEFVALVEERAAPPREGRRATLTSGRPRPLRDVEVEQVARVRTTIGELDRVLGGGVVPGSLVLIGGEPGIGKCVTGETRVLDPRTGEFLSIACWRDGRRAVLALDDTTLRLQGQRVAAFHDQGHRAVVAVRTRLGRLLRCTPTHPLLTPDGWREAASLTRGDRIAAPRALPYFGEDAMSDAAVKRIAAGVGDGAVGRASCVTSARSDVASELDTVARGLGVSRDALRGASPAARESGGVSAQEWPERRGVASLDAPQGGVPDEIFRLRRPQLALFLRTLIACDGALHVTQSGQARISYRTTTRRVAEDVQHLLLRFGFVATLRTTPSLATRRASAAYEVVIPDVGEVRRFVDEIGVDGRDAAKAAMLRLATASGSSDSRLDARGDVYWDAIDSISPDGEDDVYDLSVPGPENFVANDLIVHNSTLLGQAASHLAAVAPPVLYVSAEESAAQVRMRAERLGLKSDGLLLWAENDLTAIEAQLDEIKPRALIVDSIQTVFLPQLESAPGSVAQVRECGARLMTIAKGRGLATFLVGHVTKDGALAGPRTLEHLVDTVLYFEGEQHHAYRVLRAVKNRFGSTNELGVFQMGERGLEEVANPSGFFLAERPKDAPGSVVVASLDGTRPLLLELQALVAPASFGTPRRTVLGADYNRVCMLIAVLERRAGTPIANQDVFVNVAGGGRIVEPAADLGIAVAAASSYSGVPVRGNVVVIGEVGLTGEVRAVTGLPARLREAAQLGFREAVVPKSNLTDGAALPLDAHGVATVEEAIAVLLR